MVAFQEVPLERVYEIYQVLNERKEKGILFNKALVTSKIEGGTCSAMAFDFVSKFIEFNALPDGKDYLGSSIEMAARQIAFNTIEIESPDLNLDFSLLKMQSLLNFHSLKIINSSEAADIKSIGFQTRFKKIFHGLQNGIFAVRILEKAMNKKLEVKGHTVILIKYDEYGLFYDPNEGLIYFNRSIAEKLMRRFIQTFLIYGVHEIRFYQIEEEGFFTLKGH
ncbi:MAG: hypothetical protein ACK4HV_04955 [Parachlamydiaceae bacterium]